MFWGFVIIRNDTFGIDGCHNHKSIFIKMRTEDLKRWENVVKMLQHAPKGNCMK